MKNGTRLESIVDYSILDYITHLTLHGSASSQKLILLLFDESANNGEYPSPSFVSRKMA